MTGSNQLSDLVLIPGFMADEDLWREMAPMLRAKRCIPLVARRGDTLEAMARELLPACPPKFVAVGFSMGGYVARAIARVAPERVLGLVQIATSGRDRAPVRTVASPPAAAPVFRGMSTAAVRRAFLPENASDAMVERTKAMGARLGAEVFAAQSTLRDASDLDASRAIRCPTLVLAASDDRLRSLGESQELARAIPGAAMQVIGPSGHMLPLEQPALTAEAINAWLAAQGLA